MAALTTGRGVQVHPGVGALPPQSGDAGEWSAYFEAIYRDAEGDAQRIPWAKLRPNPAMTAWLNCEAPGLVRPGASVLVVGCGLGDDVRDLVQRGYDTHAFDISPTAVQWARARHPDLAERFVVADLLALPPSMLRRADLVVEINTVQSMHPSLRDRATGAVASLARPRGTILIICRGRDESEPLPAQPPFPLCRREVQTLMGAHGWQPIRDMDDFLDAESPPRRRLRGAFRRA